MTRKHIIRRQFGIFLRLIVADSASVEAMPKTSCRHLRSTFCSRLWEAPLCLCPFRPDTKTAETTGCSSSPVISSHLQNTQNVGVTRKKLQQNLTETWQTKSDCDDVKLQQMELIFAFNVRNHLKKLHWPERLQLEIT